MGCQGRRTFDCLRLPKSTASSSPDVEKRTVGLPDQVSGAPQRVQEPITGVRWVMGTGLESKTDRSGFTAIFDPEKQMSGFAAGDPVIFK